MSRRQRTLIISLAAACAAVFAIAGIVSLARRNQGGTTIVVPPTRSTMPEITATASPAVTPTASPNMVTPTTSATQIGSTTTAANDTTTSSPRTTSSRAPSTVPTTTTRAPTGTTAPPPGPGAIALHVFPVKLAAGQNEGWAIRRDGSQSFQVLAQWAGGEVEVCWGRDVGGPEGFEDDDCEMLESGVDLTVLPPDRSQRDTYVQLRAVDAVGDLGLRLTYAPSSSELPPVTEVRADLDLGAGDGRTFSMGPLSDLALGKVEAEATWPGGGDMQLGVRRAGADQGTATGPSPLRVTARDKADSAEWDVTLANPFAGLQVGVSVSIRFPLGVAS